MNWDALLSEIRSDLEDTSATPKFTDQDLYVYLREAVADYSQFLPLRKSDVALVQDEDNPKKFVLPTDFLAELSVACPADHFLEPRRGRLGVNVVPGNRPFFYRVDDTSLVLDADPGENEVILAYEAQHPVPAGKDDKTFELTIPQVNIELIKLYMKGRANTKLRSAQAKLDRFKIGQGQRTDNPMVEEVEDYFGVYRHKLAERIPVRSVTLYRPRRYK
jgi:hypothetical protein